MTSIYYAYRTSVYKCEPQLGAVAELVYTFPNASIKSISTVIDQVMFILVRSDPQVVDYRSIYRLDLIANPPTAIPFYEHPYQVANIEQRMIGSSPRLYFSAHTTADWSSPQAIYWLNAAKSPVLYCAADDYDLLLPNPCTGEEDDGGWRGNFAFDADNHLYLSTGNAVPAGLYRLDGAGPSEVSSLPTRIFLDEDNGIWGIACASAKEIYFHGSARIYCLKNNGIFSKNVVLEVDTGVYDTISDIACSPVMSSYWHFIWRKIKFFFLMLWRLPMTLISRR